MVQRIKELLHGKNCKSVLNSLRKLRIILSAIHDGKIDVSVSAELCASSACEFQPSLGFSDDLWIMIAAMLDGPHLSLLSCVNRQCCQMMKLRVVWQTACKSLLVFCEDPNTNVVLRDISSWRSVYRALWQETAWLSSPKVNASFVLPRCPDLMVSNGALEFTGAIGSDRAVRAPYRWTAPPTTSDCAFISKKPRRGSTWRIPPILVSCPDSPGHSEYLFADCRYFEVSILEPRASCCHSVVSDASNWCVAVGLATEDFPLEGMQPGWDMHSCAYHSDDGQIFFGNMRLMSLPCFGTGDTVGCGLRCDGRLFFTLNGRLVGVAPQLPAAFWARVQKGRGLFPTVGVDTPCPLRINCGRTPFGCAAAELRRSCFADASDTLCKLRPTRRRAAEALLDCSCIVS